jgi:hydrogenase maturation protease
VEVGTALLDGLHLFEAADRILAIDAMRAGGVPGAVYVLSPAQVEDGGIRGSLHGLGLLAALRFLRRHHPEVAILGVEPQRIDYGLELSLPVQASLPQLLRLVRRIAADWALARQLTAGEIPASAPG